jgi:hypothetical protein
MARGSEGNAGVAAISRTEFSSEGIEIGTVTLLAGFLLPEEDLAIFPYLRHFAATGKAHGIF